MQWLTDEIRHITWGMVNYGHIKQHIGHLGAKTNKS